MSTIAATSGAAIDVVGAAAPTIQGNTIQTNSLGIAYSGTAATVESDRVTLDTDHGLVLLAERR